MSFHLFLSYQNHNREDRLLATTQDDLGTSAAIAAIKDNPSNSSAVGDGDEADSLPNAGPVHSVELESSRLNGLKVLLVEDEEDTCRLISFALRHHGASVEIAVDAAEALRRLQQWRPMILLSDIGLPGEDGYELVQRVRALADAELAIMPAIALTAYAGTEDRSRAREAGFNRHLSKPVELDLLIDILEELSHTLKKSV